MSKFERMISDYTEKIETAVQLSTGLAREHARSAQLIPGYQKILTALAKTSKIMAQMGQRFSESEIQSLAVDVPAT